MIKAHLCSECGEPHVVRNLRKETLTKTKCNVLKAAAARVMETNINRFKIRDVGDLSTNPSHYNHFQKLRYHGLVAKIKDSHNEWLVTRNGWSFLRGDLKLPKFVMVKNNHVQKDGRSDTLVGLLDVLRGGDVIETTFDYFDEETGKMVARGPLPPAEKPEQATLLDVPVSQEPKAIPWL